MPNGRSEERIYLIAKLQFYFINFSNAKELIVVARLIIQGYENIKDKGGSVRCYRLVILE